MKVKAETYGYQIMIIFSETYKYQTGILKMYTGGALKYLAIINAKARINN